MMRAAGFTHCCTAQIYYDFPWDHHGQAQVNKALQTVIKKAKAHYQDGDAVAVVTLTTKQELMRAALIKEGFICSEPMKKGRHADRDLYVLYLPLDQWAATKAKKIIPRDEKGRFIKANPFK